MHGSVLYFRKVVTFCARVWIHPAADEENSLVMVQRDVIVSRRQHFYAARALSPENKNNLNLNETFPLLRGSFAAAAAAGVAMRWCMCAKNCTSAAEIAGTLADVLLRDGDGERREADAPRPSPHGAIFRMWSRGDC